MMTGDIVVRSGDRVVTAWSERRDGVWWVGAGCTCGYVAEWPVADEDPAAVEDEMEHAYQQVRDHLAEAPECSTPGRPWGERPTALGAALGALDAIEEDIYRDRLSDPGPDLWGQL